MLYKTLRERLRSTHPELMRALNPREYRGVAEWSDTEIPATQLAGALAGPPVDLYALLCACTAAQLIAYRTPHVFVSRDLAIALSQSDPPEGARWTDMPLPYPAGIVMLPAGLVRDGAERSYDYVTWCRIWAGKPICLPHGPQEFANDALIFTTSSVDDALFHGLVRSFNAETWPEARVPPPGAGEDVSNLDSSDREIIDTLSRIACGALLAMQARPDLYEPARRRGKHSRREGRREIWEPNILGRRYAIPRVQPAGGSHASPRAHWRRGHFRNQPVGPGRQSRRVVWIEPVFVSGSAD